MKTYTFITFALLSIGTTIVVIYNDIRCDSRIRQLEQRVEFFQKIWENVPEEYRKEVAP